MAVIENIKSALEMAWRPSYETHQVKIVKSRANIFVFESNKLIWKPTISVLDPQFPLGRIPNNLEVFVLESNKQLCMFSRVWNEIGLGFVSFWTVSELNSVDPSSSVCGKLAWRPSYETNQMKIVKSRANISVFESNTLIWKPTISVLDPTNPLGRIPNNLENSSFRFRKQ